MRFAETTFRPSFGRALTVVVVAIAALGMAGFVVAGDWEGLLRYGWTAALVGALAVALYWLPSLRVAENEITVRNVFTTSHVPWAAIQRIDTKYALTLYTNRGTIAVWASPAPNRYAAQATSRGEARIAAADQGGSIRPGDLLNTASGAAAFVIRRHWNELRDDGQLDSPQPAVVRRDIHWATIATLVALLIASVLGAVVGAGS
jgi:hypothetical protein